MCTFMAAAGTECADDGPLLGGCRLWIIRGNCVDRSMKILTRKLILLLAMLALPLQGLATVATFFKCHEQAAAEAGVHSAEHTHADGSSHQHHETDEGALGSSGTHSCGHCLALHVPNDVEVMILPTLGAWSQARFLSYTPYFPEHPRRPPRA